MAEIGKVARSELVISYTGPERWLAALADAVVDLVVLPLYEAVERRLARRLRKAGSWDGLAGRRNMAPVQRLPRRGRACSRATAGLSIWAAAVHARNGHRQGAEGER